MYQYSLLKQQNMLGTCPKHTWRRINTHTFLSLLLALFLCFLSRLWCRTFRFLHLFIGFVISGLRLLLERKHRIYNNKETVRKAIIMSKDDAFEKYLLLLYTHTQLSKCHCQWNSCWAMTWCLWFLRVCFPSLLKTFPGMSTQTAVRAEIMIDSGQWFSEWQSLSMA